MTPLRTRLPADPYQSNFAPLRLLRHSGRKRLQYLHTRHGGAVLALLACMERLRRRRGAQAWLRTRSGRAQDGPGTARRSGPVQTPSLDAPARFWRLLACMERLRRRRGAAARGRIPHRQAPATVGKYDSKLSTGACMVGAEARRGARARETGRLDGSGHLDMTAQDVATLPGWLHEAA